MQLAETILDIYGKRGKEGKPIEGIYRQLFNIELYLRAYNRIYKNAGSMTRGVTDETVDGMSKDKIQRIIDRLREEKYRWNPGRRVLIPKSNGKTRPLGLPTWSDKLLQEVMRSLMDAYYEPQFSSTSHGFRPGRGCHTALRDVFTAWTGTKWFIEGDIKGCFDNINHKVLMSILREKIHDERFLNLMKRLLEAGYLEEWSYRPTLSGTPQGGVISPLLSNIYMDRLDKFVEETLIPRFTKGNKRNRSLEKRRLRNQLQKLQQEDRDHKDIPVLQKKIANMVSGDPIDPHYRRLRYIRYADDFLLGFAGPRIEAVEIKDLLTTFLLDKLHLEMSPEKTLITHALSEKAHFLGYDISADGPTTGRALGHITLRIPVKKLKEKISRYCRNGKPIQRAELINESDLAIVDKYGSEYRGIWQYYAYARNRRWLNRLHWYMRSSLLRTLADKHKSTIKKMATRFSGESISKHGVLKCLHVIVEREGKRPLYAKFGGLSLRMDPFVEIVDDILNKDRIVPRSDLLDRLRADMCELCGSRYKVQVHHVRKLSDLKRGKWNSLPTWKRAMVTMRRKTLLVCEDCHVNIHAGRPTRSYNSELGSFPI